MLASGGFGITYESELKLGTRVAIKEYYPADLRSLQGCSAIIRRAPRVIRAIRLTGAPRVRGDLWWRWRTATSTLKHYFRGDERKGRVRQAKLLN